MSAIAIDTDIIIDLANGDAIAINRLERESQTHRLQLPMIVVMELTVGCRNKRELQALDQLLEQFDTIDHDRDTTEIAYQLLRRYTLSHGLRIPDALVAATAIANNLPLLSKNQRDYRFVGELDLLPYP